jgi:hypothetical protein
VVDFGFASYDTISSGLRTLAIAAPSAFARGKIMRCHRSVLSLNLWTLAAAITTAVSSVLAAANAAQAQTVVHVRTADLRASDTANLKIEPVHWHGGAYYHSYYRAPYRAYNGGPYRSYYGGNYRYYGGGAYRAWYGNPYYAYWRYPSYYYAPRYYGPTYYGYPGYSTYYAPTVVPNVYPYSGAVVAAPYGGFYW